MEGNQKQNKLDNPTPPCHEFIAIEHFCVYFVEDLIHTASEILRDKMKCDIFYDYTALKIEEKIHWWPRIKDFTITLGAAKIDEYINNSNEADEDWHYAINFRRIDSDSTSDYYEYEVVFAIPTPMYPIPQGTVSLYFKYELSRTKPAHCPVDITFQMEGFGTVMKPYDLVINDKLLLRGIKTKLANYKQFTF
ncbi:unnamed protein product [Phyllotreta striolata]|uniref:Uncharacterized protein n=1 Tax=Phyllotreta striolata TaxID=444603 RepID=A0A9N9TUI9_PHYSR|nr:unnamed protein product [Phyllotreta striolata]